jgi:hypothetical protein
MIVNHKHQFIFFKTKKTASTSLEIALSRFCDKSDIISPLSEEEEEKRFEFAGLRAQNYRCPPWDYTLYDALRCIWYGYLKGFYDHISAAESKEILGEAIWNSYYKFAVDRNPWDKVISFYYWSAGYQRHDSIKQFLIAEKVHHLSSFDQLTINGVLAVDEILRYEELEVQLPLLTSRLNLETDLLLPEYRAKGEFRKDRRHYREVLTSEEAEMISRMFAREIYLMKYVY